MLRTRALLGVALLATAACSPAPSPTPDAEATPTLQASPTPTGDQQDAAAAPVLARIHTLHIAPGDIIWTLYRDGRVVETLFDPDVGSILVERRLTDAGVEAVVSEMTRTGLFEASGRYEPTWKPGPLPGRGTTWVTITLDRGDRVVEVEFDAVIDPEYQVISPEREALANLLARLTTLADWLADDAFARAGSERYAPERWLLLLSPSPGFPATDAIAAIDDLAWPFDPGYDAWGVHHIDPFGDLTHDRRCGIIDRGQLESLAAALREIGIRLDEPLQHANLWLEWRAGNGAYAIDLIPLLPDGQPSTPQLWDSCLAS